MDSDGSQSNSDKIIDVPKKKRLSLFLPQDITVTVPESTNTSDKEYKEKLKLEEDNWKQIYNEQKQQKKALLKELDIKKPKSIDYSLFDEEEIQYLKAAPDIAKFVEDAEALQDTVKLVSAQYRAQRQNYNLIINNADKLCSIITSKLNNTS